MQIRNNYDREVYNGDIGRIVKLDDELQEATLAFDGREVLYEYSDLDEIVLSYAVSVHKSQGAEYPSVVMPLLMQRYTWEKTFRHSRNQKSIGNRRAQ